MLVLVDKAIKMTAKVSNMMQHLDSSLLIIVICLK